MDRPMEEDYANSARTGSEEPPMRRSLNLLASLIALIGFALVLLSGIWRLTGTYTVLGVGTIAYMQAGTAAMVAACVVKLELLLQQH